MGSPSVNSLLPFSLCTIGGSRVLALWAQHTESKYYSHLAVDITRLPVKRRSKNESERRREEEELGSNAC